MSSLIRNPLTIVWALLTAVTVVSWLVSRDGGGAAHQLNATVTTVVLLIAAAKKTQLVMWHFMEVRRARGGSRPLPAVG